MPLIILIILLAAPLLDIFLAISWLFASPLAAGAYLAATMLAGALMLKFAKIGAVGAANMLSRHNAAIFAVLGFVRVGVAGGLLLFPGYLSDVLAVILLCLPGKWFPKPPPEQQDDNAPLEAKAEIVRDERNVGDN